MKKIKLVLAALTLISSLAFANFKDVPKTHWSSQAVTDLYNKGLLAPTVTESEAFKGDGVFSRYEIASMLYYNVVYMSEKLETKANAGDVIALKALVADFAPELAKMGANVEEMEAKLDENLAKLEAKLNKKITKLQEDISRVRITGNFTADQTIGMKKNKPGMGELEFEGDLNVLGKLNDNVSTRVTLTLDQKDRDTTLPELGSFEIKAKMENGGSVTAFRDADKEVASFENTLAQFSGTTVDPDQGVIVNGNANVLGGQNRYVAMFYQTETGDFYGLQTKQEIPYFKALKIDAFVRGSYAEKILGDKYQYDGDVGAKAEDAKAIYSVDGQLVFRPGSFFNLTAEGEFATRRSPTIQNIDSEAVDYLPGLDFLDSRDAIYLYANGTLKLPALGVFGLAAGIYNSGEYFDVGGMGDTEKTVFAETGIIKTELNKKAIMVKGKYDLFGLNYLLAEATYASYGENTKVSAPEKDVNALVTLNLIPNKVKMEGSASLTIDEKIFIDDTLFNDYIDGELEGEKGVLSVQSNNTITLFGNSTQHINVIYEDDQDKEDYEDTDKTFEIYADHEMNIGDNVYFKVAGSYEKAGLSLEDRLEWKPISNVWELRPDYNTFDERNTVEVAAALEVETGKFGTVTFGGYYYNEDQKGGLDGQAGYNYRTDTWATADDTTYKKDKENTALFIVHEFSLGNFTFTYGAKKLEEKEGVENTESTKVVGTTSIDSDWNFVDRDKDDSGEYDLLYGIGIEYDFGDDTVASFRYGDPTVRQDSTNFMNDGTSFADGEQDEFTFIISTRF